MSDPLRTDAAHGADDSAAADRDARIEQLLLAGLDHYFAADYEQAINVWSRVIFLDRNHGRARAYIDRARGALAERHRESEELLHRGVDAFNRGDTGEARDLINRAIEHIGPNDVALAFLERLNRLDPASSAAESASAPAPPEMRRPRVAPAATASKDQSWLIVAIAAIVSGAALLLAGTGIGIWFAEQPAARLEAMRPVAAPLPVVRASETALAKARQLRDDGHLRDALRTLEAIGIADPLKAEADSLRAEIQRRLLETVRAPDTAAVSGAAR